MNIFRLLKVKKERVLMENVKKDNEKDSGLKQGRDYKRLIDADNLLSEIKKLI